MQQFWQALFARPEPELLQQARHLLSPELFELFCTMPYPEQAHALDVFQRLQSNGHVDQNLLTAALLHDVGKTRCPPDIWERVLVVLVQHFTPKLAERWGSGEPRGLKRSLVAAKRHPEWGAEMVDQSGASPQVVELIRRHHDGTPYKTKNEVAQFLAALQAADDHN